MSKKSWPILYIKLKYKIGQDFLDRQCYTWNDDCSMDFVGGSLQLVEQARLHVSTPLILHFSLPSSLSLCLFHFICFSNNKCGNNTIYICVSARNNWSKQIFKLKAQHLTPLTFIIKVGICGSNVTVCQISLFL